MAPPRFLKRSPTAIVAVIGVVTISLFAAIDSSEFPRKIQEWLVVLVGLSSVGALWLLPPLQGRNVRPDIVEVRGVFGWARAIALLVLVVLFAVGVYTRSLNLAIASTSLVAATSLNFVINGSGQIHGDISRRLVSSVLRIANSNFWMVLVSVTPACLILLATIIFSGTSLSAIDFLPPALFMLTSVFALLQCRNVAFKSEA